MVTSAARQAPPGAMPNRDRAWPWPQGCLAPSRSGLAARGVSVTESQDEWSSRRGNSLDRIRLIGPLCIYDPTPAHQRPDGGHRDGPTERPIPLVLRSHSSQRSGLPVVGDTDPDHSLRFFFCFRTWRIVFPKALSLERLSARLAEL